jgi:hypothetical protein
MKGDPADALGYRPPVYNPGMRVIVTGDRNWYAPELAAEVVKRLLIRYGRSLATPASLPRTTSR